MKSKKYQIIYADPPWEYRLFSRKGTSRTAASHYDTMRLVDIYELPIYKIADKNCVLFLWATLPAIKEALHTIKFWGFDYKTVGFVWVKKNKKKDSWFWGMGTWTRANAELCLIATKGNIKPISHSVHQIIDSKIREHSKKPDEVRKRIVELMGNLPRIELFARKNNELFNEFDGWDVWGNEVESDIDLLNLEK